MNKIGQCLWFDTHAEEAARFYTSLFKNSKIGKTARYGKASSKPSGKKPGSVMSVEFEIEGQAILGLNGGPLFKFTPAFSYFVWCDSEKEIDNLWQKLSSGGEVRMGLDKYPFAEKYGFTADKFGVNWQLILSTNSQKIAPAFLFVEKLLGRGEEAIKCYSAIFKNSQTEIIHRDEATKSVAHSIFSLDGQKFVLMEGQGKHPFAFNNAFSLTVSCETQKEIDEYWSKLTDGGSPGPCGWLTDRFGISWQIVPAALRDMVSDQDAEKAERVMAAIMQMQKLDIKTLQRAYAAP